jgi:hypothetical protein
LIRQPWFRAAGICTAAIALAAVILTPSRPLWPAQSFFVWAVKEFPNNKLIARAQTVFAVYHSRNDIFAPLRERIPDSVPVVGMIEAGDDAEASLWRPFGSRQVVDVREDDCQKKGQFQWLVVRDSLIADGDPAGYNQWLQQNHGELVTRQLVTEKVGAGAEYWSVVRLSDVTP